MHLSCVNSRTLRVLIVNNESHAFFSGYSAKLFGHFLYNNSERRRVRVESYRTTMFQELLHQIIKAADLRHHDINEGLDSFSILQFAGQCAEGCRYAKKRVANLMRHSSDELANDRQSLGDNELLGQAFLLRNIFDDAEVEYLATGCVGDSANTQPGRHRF